MTEPLAITRLTSTCPKCGDDDDTAAADRHRLLDRGAVIGGD